MIANQDDPAVSAESLDVGSPSTRSVPRRLTLLVIVLGVVATGALTLSSRTSYLHTEQRLTNLQTRLTASLLGIAPVDLERRIGQVVGVSGESAHHVGEFRRAIASSMAPKGPFVTATLAVVRGGRLQVLDRVGAQPLRSPTGKVAATLFLKSAATSSLVTTRATVAGQQRLGYFMSYKTSSGTYVVAAGQALPKTRRVSIPSSSPEAGLDFAIYFGRAKTSDALVETDVSHPPLTGTTSSATVPFGTSELTLVMAPRAALSGPWSRFLPWGILFVGLVLSAGIGLMTERLIRRREGAEHLAVENRRLYSEQRNISVSLQRSLLPKALPSIPGVELSARYIPGEVGAEVGGDWYSVIAVDDQHFAFVVGDVSGRGIEAATIMAGLRYTIRAYASLGFGPAEILNMAARELDIESDKHFATVLVGVVNSERRELTMASAGHFEALVVHDGRGEYVSLPIGVPLGVAAEPYSARTVEIEPHSTLIAYTDGLIERRGEAIDVGLDRLRIAALGGGNSVDALLSTIVAEVLAGRGSDDDTAILGVRWE